MRWSVAVTLLVLALPAAAQVQPGAPPEPAAYTQRMDVAEAGALAGAQRVLRFVQVSDAHILDDDAPYPLRQEPLDPYITAFSTAAQRPQDEYTDEVLASIVRAINLQHAADAFQFVVNTGDNIDNDLENELMRFIDLWDGSNTTTGPLSGLACLPDGQSASVADTQNDVTEQCTSLPASLAGHAPLAPGLPWYSAFGNHDTLIQGNVNPNGPFDEVAADSGRHLLTQPEYVAMHFPGLEACAGGTAADDFGHGYGLAAGRLCDDDPDNDGYYAFELSGVRFLVLDTINDDFASANGFTQGAFNLQDLVGADVIGGYAEGSVDPAQWEWLRAEVAANPDKLLVLFSHHTINSMFTNLADTACAPGLGCLADALAAAGYATGAQLQAELATHPNVAGWFGGHTHRHRIQPKPGAAGEPGFWNVETSSLIDWPQQARAIELWVTADGSKAFWLLRSFGHDVQVSKDLEATDPQREAGASGAPEDGDTILWFDVPDGVVLTPQPAQLPRGATPFSDDVAVHVTSPTTAPVGAYEVRALAVRGAATPVAGLALSVHTQSSTPAGCGELHADFVTSQPVPMQAGHPGQYLAFVELPHATSYTLVITADGPDPVEAARHVVVASDGQACPSGSSKGKDSPGLPLVALLGLAAAIALARRAR